MKILFLGDVVGPSGCEGIKSFLPEIIKENQIDFVVVNGENAANEGVGITEKIANDFFNSGVNVITSGNHIWDNSETMNYISKEIQVTLAQIGLSKISDVNETNLIR